jgi:hypothetical protein
MQAPNHPQPFDDARAYFLNFLQLAAAHIDDDGHAAGANRLLQAGFTNAKIGCHIWQIQMRPQHLNRGLRCHS